MRGQAFGEPFTFQDKNLMAKPMLVPYDPTQFERKILVIAGGRASKTGFGTKTCL